MAYPTCDMCGAEMTQFDGVSWYTCPNCGNRVRIVDDNIDWERDIFNEKGTKDFSSDFKLADFCHGGDLTED